MTGKMLILYTYNPFTAIRQIFNYVYVKHFK